MIPTSVRWLPLLFLVTACAQPPPPAPVPFDTTKFSGAKALFEAQGARDYQVLFPSCFCHREKL